MPSPGGSRSRSVTTAMTSIAGEGQWKGHRSSGARRPGNRGTLRTARDAGTRRSDWWKAGSLERSGRRHEVELRLPVRTLSNIRQALLAVAPLARKTAHVRGDASTTSSPIRILTVDDHPLVREGSPVSWSSVGYDLGRRSRQRPRHDPAIPHASSGRTLMDLQMPEMNGLTPSLPFARSFRRQGSSC